ncbi:MULTISPECIES: MerR family transcriptional regulator [Brucella]|uniref:MerR family transcriptional regulator n=1 Tax=Brucella TaxID=234 RepID=UPI0001B47C96|nr:MULTISPECIES: MerR family transcriptional regulator [Brucella]AIJ69885.1 merR regulatory family protein [Brucella suis bv. 3 str. 686]EEY30904.1 transcriptional regulator [Brucella suis bv. 3 str. 686]MXF78996.1 MerR family transcriptional regulator [Brucella melitensis]QOK62779.1 MerR family transcriptional regulator [Brucella suis bv. 3]
MKIGELAKRSGLAASRIRFYESIGLLKTVDRRSNGYRTYPEEAVLVLHLIATAQKAGFSLDEIRTLLPPDLDNWEHDALIEVLRRKVADIEALEARLARSKLQLLGLISDIEAKPDDMACADNARRVLSRLMAEEMEAPASLQDEGRPYRRTTI